MAVAKSVKRGGNVPSQNKYATSKLATPRDLWYSQRAASVAHQPQTTREPAQKTRVVFQKRAPRRQITLEPEPVKVQNFSKTIKPDSKDSFLENLDVAFASKEEIIPSTE